jgi:hypothetical protein
LFFLSFIPLVSSAQPSVLVPTTAQALQIEHPYIETLQSGQLYKFHFHVYNSSTGKPVNMSLVSCSFHLYNSSGSHIFKNNNGVGSDDVLDYEQIINGGNFTKNKEYSFLFACNSSAEGGFYENSFYVTQNGDRVETGTGLIYFLVTLFAFGIFFLITWLFLNINGENPKDETGYLGINYRKYIKCALFPLVYVTFLWFFNFIIGLSGNYLGLTLYSNTLEFVFMILTKLVYPIIVLCCIIAIVLMVKDSNIKKEYQSLWSQY